MSVNNVTRRNLNETAQLRPDQPKSPHSPSFGGGQDAASGPLPVTDAIVLKLSGMGKGAASIVSQLVSNENGVLLPLDGGSGSVRLRLDKANSWIVVSDANATVGPKEFHWTELRKFVFEELRLDAQFGGLDQFGAKHPEIITETSPHGGPKRQKSAAEQNLMRQVQDRMRRTLSQNLYAPQSAGPVLEATTSQFDYDKSAFVRMLNRSRSRNDLSNTLLSLTYAVRDVTSGAYKIERSEDLSPAAARLLVADLDTSGRLGKGTGYNDVFFMNGIGGYAGATGTMVSAEQDLARRESYFFLGLMNDDERVAAVQSELEPVIGRLPTTFSERSYARLAEKCCDANTVERGTISMAFPVRASITPPARPERAELNGKLPPVPTHVTQLYLDVTPTEAMELLQQDNLLYPPRDILEENGLSLEALSIREAVLEQQQAGSALEQ